MIRLNCFIRVKSPENHDQVLSDALLLTENSLTENGCIAYDVFQSTSRPDVLMICETWADEASLDAHQKTELFHRLSTNMRALADFKTERFTF